MHADKIHIGRDAPEPAVLGDTWVDLMGQLLDALASETHPAPGGTTGPPSNAAIYRRIKSRLRNALSKFVTIKKSP